jgi:hypothetical protein
MNMMRRIIIELASGNGVMVVLALRLLMKKMALLRMNIKRTHRS